MAKQTQTPYVEESINAGGAIAQKVAQSVGSQVQQLGADIDLVEGARDRAVMATANRIARILDPNAFTEDVFATLHNIADAQSYRPMFSGVTIDTSVMTEPEQRRLSTRPSVSDFLALGPASENYALEAGSDDND